MGTRSPIPSATRPEIEAAIADWLVTNGRAFDAVQTRYFRARGLYFQGIYTPDVAPDDGVERTADYTKRPTDQPDAWADVFIGVDMLPATVPASLQCDVYTGPQGDGWLLLGTYSKGGRFYEKVLIHRGPETHREHDWQEVTR